jgi:hypothetical protein
MAFLVLPGWPLFSPMSFKKGRGGGDGASPSVCYSVYAESL